MPLLTDADFASIRDALAVFLVHTYTRIAVTEGTEDAWGDAAETASSGASGIPCHFVWDDNFVRTAEGVTRVSTPTLSVAHDDPLEPGDRVANIRGQDGAILLAGPAAVETVDPRSGLGASLKKVATLRAADVGIT